MDDLKKRNPLAPWLEPVPAKEEAPKEDDTALQFFLGPAPEDAGNEKKVPYLNPLLNMKFTGVTKKG